MAARVKTSKPVRPLTPEAIVNAALAIADTEGLAALSMRRIAAALGCNPMSLYEHVANKEALLDLMADQAMAALPELSSTADWRAEMDRFFTAFHELFLTHPAIAHVMVTRPLSGPVTLTRAEPALAVLSAAGMTDTEAVQLFIALAAYTIGASLYELARRDTSRRDTQIDQLDPASHPTVRRLAPQLRAAAGPGQFEHGLKRLLADAGDDVSA